MCIRFIHKYAALPEAIFNSFSKEKVVQKTMEWFKDFSKLFYSAICLGVDLSLPIMERPFKKKTNGFDFGVNGDEWNGRQEHCCVLLKKMLDDR